MFVLLYFLLFLYAGPLSHLEGLRRQHHDALQEDLAYKPIPEITYAPAIA